MEQKEVTELADGHGGVKEESVSPVFHNHIMLSLWSGTSRSAIFVCRFAGGGWNAGGVSVVSGNAGGRRIARQVYRSLSGLQCLHYFGGCLARGNQLEFGILAQVVETAPGAHSTFTSVMFSTVNSAIEWAPRLRILFENTPRSPICICCPFNNCSRRQSTARIRMAWISRASIHIRGWQCGNRTCPVSLLVSTGRWHTPSWPRLCRWGYHACRCCS